VTGRGEGTLPFESSGLHLGRRAELIVGWPDVAAQIHALTRTRPPAPAG
jgi:hypothetical protein